MTATYEKIATTTVSAVSSITLSSIPATYTDLVLVGAELQVHQALFICNLIQ